MEQFKNYVVMNIADQILEDQSYRRSRYDITIQSGCALTDKRIAELSDDEGDNISALNPSYSEITALYWVWKHQKSEYIGWRHYRRYLEISDGDIEQCIKEGIDVIMPKPLKLERNVQEQYILSTDQDSWVAMMRVLQRREPDYYQVAKVVFGSDILFPFCMGIWSRQYFEGYCQFLFPILEEVYREIGEKWDVYKNRYVAFLAERLHSLYFMTNSEKLKYRIVNVIMLDTVESRITYAGITEEQALEVIGKMLRERKAFAAFEVSGRILGENRNEEWKFLKKLHRVLCVVKIESIFTEMTLCRYSDDWKVLLCHYDALANYLRQLESETSGFPTDDFLEYLEMTGTSVYAIGNVAEMETTNTVSVLLKLAQICIEHQQMENAKYYLIKIQGVSKVKEMKETLDKEIL